MPTPKLEPLEMWTIYDHPTDHPNHFVVRCWIVDGGDPVPGGLRLAHSLAGARQLLPPGLYRCPRQEGDDTKIIETWI